MAYTKTEWVSGETKLSADNMNHIEDGIAAVDSNLSSLIMVKRQEISGSMSPGTEQQGVGFAITGTVKSYTGYTPIGVIGFSSTHDQTCRVGRVNIDGTTLKVYGANNGNPTSLTCYLDVLYIKIV